MSAKSIPHARLAMPASTANAAAGWGRCLAELEAVRERLEFLAFVISAAAPEAAAHRDPARRVQAIIRIAELQFNLPAGVILGRIRTARILWPRQLAMRMARDFTQLSLHELAGIFRRDHSSLHYACTAVANRLQTDCTAAKQAAELAQTIKNFFDETDRAFTEQKGPRGPEGTTET